MDALSDVLRTVRLRGATFFDIHASNPWVAETPPGSSIVGMIFPGVEHLISYHVITQGACWGRLLDEPATHLSAGDVIVFPHGDAHIISSDPGMRGMPDISLYRPPHGQQLPFTLSMGETDADPAHVICGFLGCDARPFNPLLASLPRVIHISNDPSGALRAFVSFAIAESKHPRIGSDSMLGRLSELMFVDVVRRYVETLPADRTGWLAGLRDPFVGRALTSLHHSPAQGWTLEKLAREVGLSRSVLAERFTELVGQPAMQYLTNWRMQLAANHLLSSTDSVATVAERIGYESEAAFSRAFKKIVGAAPGEWRKQRQRATRERVVGSSELNRSASSK